VKSGRGVTFVMMNQAQRDVALVRAKEVRLIKWHFYISPISGKVGPSPKILDLLDSLDIPYYVHWA
jgi:hypothetical protein